MVHPLEVWLQSRVAGRKASQVNLRFGSEFLVLTGLAQGFGTEAELFQFLQDVRLDIPFLTELHETL